MRALIMASGSKAEFAKSLAAFLFFHDEICSPVIDYW